MTEINIEISSAVVNIETLKYSEFVTRGSSRGIRNVVLGWNKKLTFD